MRKLLLSLVLLIATIALYSPVHRHEFVLYDDQLYVTGNINIQNGVNWETVKWAFTSQRGGNWHPLTWLSHALDCQFFLIDSAAHHDVNLIFHVCNVLLLFWVLLQSTGFIGRSFMVAALFALHPINVESVAWVAERKNLLSMLFFLLALGAYRWYARQPTTGRVLLVAFLYALGLMAKPQIITFPWLLLLWDYWPLKRMFASEQQVYPGTAPESEIDLAKIGLAKGFSWLLIEKLPLFALSVASAVITMKTQWADGAMVWHPYLLRLENAIVAYVRYLGKAFYPSRLAVLYPYPSTYLPAWHVYASLVLLVATTSLVANRRVPGYLTVGWFWFLGTLVPMIGLVQVGFQAMADRYAYLPFIGLFIMVCWGGADLATRERIPRLWLAVASVTVLLALAMITYHQIGYWSNGIALWSRTLQVTSGNAIAEDSLALEMLVRGKREEAISHFFRAIQFDPNDPTSNLDIGNYEQMNGRLSEALEYYKNLVRLAQAPPSLKHAAFLNMGHIYRSLGDEARAQECFSAADWSSRRPGLQLKP